MKNSWSILIVALGLFPILCPAVALPQQGQQSSCTVCHSGLGGSDARVVEQWRGSVHAKNGVSCQGCHGGDHTDKEMSAMSPEKGFKGAPKSEEIPQFCGECHPGVKEDYLTSLHGEALSAGGPQCVTCHGSHAIELASLKLINSGDCSRCHGYERAATIREALAETDERIASLDRSLKKLHRIGMAAEDLNRELFDARNTFHRLFHSVDVKKVRDNTGEIQSRLLKIGERVDIIESKLTRRKQAGAVVVCLLLLMTFLFLYLRHTYKQEEKR